MKSRTEMVLMVAASLALGACATSDDRVVPSVEAPRPTAGESRTAADELVAYLSRLRGMGETALVAEVTRQKEFAARDATDLARLKAALALALSAQSEESDVLALVEPIVRRQNGDPDAKAVASFLQVIVAERRRLKESATAARTGLRDERRAAEVQKQRADSLQERAAQLQQKLDALTELEKSLSKPSPSR